MPEVDHNMRRVVDTGRRSSYSYHEQTVANVREELQRALAALDSFEEDRPPEDDKGAIFDRLTAMVDAYDALQNLDHWLPPVWGWCVGYPWGSLDCYSVFSAHLERDTAEAWLELYWRPKHDARPGWEVTFRQCEVRDFLKGRP